MFVGVYEGKSVEKSRNKIKGTFITGRTVSFKYWEPTPTVGNGRRSDRNRQSEKRDVEENEGTRFERVVIFLLFFSFFFDLI